MNATDFTFRLTAYDIDRFLPQVRKALEKRSELLSRKRFPAVWKITDKLGTSSHPGKRKSNSLDRSARALLNGKDTLSEEQAMEISFFETAMILPGGGDDDCVLYEDFQCVIETADLFLLVFGTRAAVLQKRDLITGGLDAFRAFIAGNVAQYHSLA